MCSGSWSYLRGLPTSYKTTSILSSSDVYLGRAGHPSFWHFDSCESRDDLIRWRVAEQYLDSNLVCFAGSSQRFVSFCPKFVCRSRSDVGCVCQQIKKVNKQTNKLSPGLEQQYVSSFVLGQWRWSHMPLVCIYAVMHAAIYYFLKFDLFVQNLQYHPWP